MKMSKQGRKSKTLGSHVSNGLSEASWKSAAGVLALARVTRVFALFFLLSPVLLFSQVNDLPAPRPLSSPFVTSLETVPWMAISGAALVLGFLAFVLMRVFGGGKHRSSGRSRGGWILSNDGLGEAQAGASDDEGSSGGSSSFTGGGAGSNW